MKLDQWRFSTELAEALIKMCRVAGFRLSTAESCTGGWIGATLTALAGVSDVFEGGILAYQNRVKSALLGVSETTLATFGAVSEACAREMAIGANARLQSDVAIAVTGIAGPGGATAEKPVGLVYIGVAIGQQTFVEECFFNGDRQAVRQQTVERALAFTRECLEKERKRNG